MRSLLFAALLLPSIAFGAPRTFSELAGVLVSFINAGVGVLIIAGIVVYFWGISSNILKFGGSENKALVRTYFVWGILILFVMVSIWGIVELVQNTIFGGSSTAPNGESGIEDPSFNAPRWSD